MAAGFYALATLKDKFGDKERGAGVVEYALVIGGISLLLILGTSLLNDGLRDFWTALGARLTGIATEW